MLELVLNMKFIPDDFSISANAINWLSAMVWVIILFVSRMIVLTLHELGHWIAGGFKGKLVFRWFPWPQGVVDGMNIDSSSEDSFFHKIYVFFVMEAGCAVNMVFAISAFMFFPVIDLSNWIYVLIYSLGFIGLLSTVFNISFGSDHTSIFHIFGIHNIIIRVLIGTIIGLALLYVFKDYYVIQFFQIVHNIAP